jgi:hypothetical protein
MLRYSKVPQKFSARVRAEAFSHIKAQREYPETLYKKLHVVQSAESDYKRLPVDATEADLHNCADQMVRVVYQYAQRWKNPEITADGIAMLCKQLGIAEPAGTTSAEKIARAVSRSWWLRNLRKEHARRFENVAVSLGFVSYKAGVYLSDESAQRQIKRNKENAEMLARTEMQNESGQVYTLEELAALGMANKAIRRGELMTRIRGFEEIARDLGHTGMFWTLTCPSKYHAVLSKSGEMNPAYQNLSPRDAQAYLCKVWARIRAKLKRDGIAPYGFRIAEPHHDGCPHWHLLLFVPAEQAKSLEKTVRKYALAEDGTEPGAEKNRVKVVTIEAGKGSAAGYIAKYVAKNIDGAHVGEHKTQDGWIVAPDMLGNEEITPSRRVTLWSQLHGIRQFQQIGGAPVGVWRELRRIEYSRVLHASEDIKQAWAAVQKSADARASFAEYCKAQGGVLCGRNYKVRIARKDIEIVGKYATYTEQKPCGVYSVTNPHAVFESVRYRWTKVEKGGAVDCSPWTRVNNCMQDDEPVEQFTARIQAQIEKIKAGILKTRCYGEDADQWFANWRMRN